MIIHDVQTVIDSVNTILDDTNLNTMIEDVVNRLVSFGYIPTEEMFATNVYPIQLCHGSRWMPETGDLVTDKAIAMGKEFRLRVGMRQLMEFFALHHLPAELAVKTYKLYGEAAMDMLYDDPYLLTEDGLEAPFGAVDRFAVEMGVELITCNNPDRVLEILRSKGLHK